MLLLQFFPQISSLPLLVLSVNLEGRINQTIDEDSNEVLTELLKKKFLFLPSFQKYSTLEDEIVLIKNITEMHLTFINYL